MFKGLISSVFKLTLFVITIVLSIRFFPDLMFYMLYIFRYWKLFLISIIINFLIYRYIIKPYIFKRKFEYTVAQIKHSISDNVSVGIVGDVGNDKSSIDTLLVQIAELRNIELMTEKHMKIRLILSKLNFFIIDSYIYQKFDYTKVHTSSMYIDFTREMLKETGLAKKLVDIDEIDGEEIYTMKEYNYQPFTKIEADELLSEYVEITYYLYFRQRHVLSNTTIESVNTGFYSMIMQESLIQLYRSNDMAIEKYLIINEDEKGITDNSRISSKRDKESIKQNEDGKDVWYMILRHLGKGTIKHYNINQRVEDVTAFMRRLYQIIIESVHAENYLIYDYEIAIIERMIVLSQTIESKYQKWFMKLIKVQKIVSNKLYQKNFEKYSAYTDENNVHKAFQRNMYKLSQKLKKAMYRRNILYVHKRIDDVGKDILDSNTRTRSFAINCIYDVNWVYGKYDTHALSYIADLRNEKASKSLATVDSFDSMTVSEDEYRNMGYRNFDRILDSLENPEMVSDGNLFDRLDDKTESSSMDDEPENISYDMYE